MGYLGTISTERKVKLMLEDIHIVCNNLAGKAKITGVTSKGYDWIKANMSGESPITVDVEHVPDLEKTFEEAGLTVLSR